MAVDSLLLVSAAILFAACIGAWRMAAGLRAPARLPLRFSAMALSALGVAAALNLGDAAALLLLPLVGTSLAQAALARFVRPLHTGFFTTALMASLACGLAAMLSGFWMLSLVPLTLAALAILAAGLHGMTPIAGLAGSALLAAGLTLPAGGAAAGTLLLCAAAVVGMAMERKPRSAAAVHQQRLAGLGGAIGGVQPAIGMTAFRHDLTQDLRHK